MPFKSQGAASHDATDLAWHTTDNSVSGALVTPGNPRQ